MKNPIGWFEIYTDDIHRATKFYETVFEVKLESLFDPSDTNVIMHAFPADM